MKKQFYSLQGIIFQEGNQFETGFKPSIGIAVIIQKVMNYSMLHGIVSTNDDSNLHILSGVMADQWGQSIIHNFIMNENGISFTKVYDQRLPINYWFREKKGDIWYGAYTGTDCGKGTAKLIVTPIDESFFFPSDE